MNWKKVFAISYNFLYDFIFLWQLLTAFIDEFLKHIVISSVSLQK